MEIEIMQEITALKWDLRRCREVVEVQIDDLDEIKERVEELVEMLGNGRG